MDMGPDRVWTGYEIEFPENSQDVYIRIVVPDSTPAANRLEKYGPMAGEFGNWNQAERSINSDTLAPP